VGGSGGRGRGEGKGLIPARARMGNQVCTKGSNAGEEGGGGGGGGGSGRWRDGGGMWRGGGRVEVLTPKGKKKEKKRRKNPMPQGMGERGKNYLLLPSLRKDFQPKSKGKKG